MARFVRSPDVVARRIAGEMVLVPIASRTDNPLKRTANFYVLNATGELLWKFETESGMIGQAMTYLGPDGKQYVAIEAGVGGWSGAIVAGDIDPRDSTAALGFVNVMKDLPQASTKGGMLYVFSL